MAEQVGVIVSVERQRAELPDPDEPLRVEQQPAAGAEPLQRGKVEGRA